MTSSQAPKFLVVEIDSKVQALEMVQLMLDNGYFRLMLLDDLSKHPTINDGKQRKHDAASPALSESAPPNEPVQKKRKPNPFEEIEKTLIEPKVESTVYEEDPSTSGTDTLNLLQDLFEFNGDINIPLGMAMSELGMINSSSPDIKTRAPRTGDPSSKDDYHFCQMCGTRIKAPRGAKWNLQMHVIALHSANKPYKCSMCDFEDYTTREKKIEWHRLMGVCFPVFAHRSGFLKEDDPEVRENTAQKT
ncbi:unnamed protein product [Caenorhabditis bovis]|uniref:C2H2-type domain-containing protein n=1 Tax=Caenorhabditis bovis TaxID=2654633 RepID=A0A8S1EWV6_9PELO|nr:unnamed protein product [Caenorhabditis bovis]